MLYEVITEGAFMSTENHVTPQGTYINGKGQVIDILRLLSPQEKARILNHINSKNPTMARELAERCVSFANVEALGDNDVITSYSIHYTKLYEELLLFLLLGH